MYTAICMPSALIFFQMFLHLVIVTFLTPSTLANSDEYNYILQEDYPVSSFFSKFDFFSCGIPEVSCDPTHGFVQYVEQATAQLSGFLTTTNSSVIIGTDSTTSLTWPPDAPGRKSVRIESKNSYNTGLFVLDLKHMPAGVCGTWPSFWMTGSNTHWPQKGEIDIIEGVNLYPGNSMTLHTSAGCAMDGTGATGTWSNHFCDVRNSDFTGCGFHDSRPTSFGSAFNADDGGIFVTEWTDDAIKIWFLPRSTVEGANALSENPSPGTWGSPAASFQGGCVISDHFQDLRMIFDLTFCGDWAGADFQHQCKTTTGINDCQAYVATNPSAFADMYWEIYSLKVYQRSSSWESTGSASTSTSTTSTTTTSSPVLRHQEL